MGRAPKATRYLKRWQAPTRIYDISIKLLVITLKILIDVSVTNVRYLKRPYSCRYSEAQDKTREYSSQRKYADKPNANEAQSVL